MSNYFNKNIDEGLFNPKTVGTDMRVTQGLSPLGQEYGRGAIQAQRQALTGYQGIANGTAPSLAQMQMQAGVEQNNRAAMGLMGQSRGGNIAGAYGQALGAMSGANAQAVQQGAMLRANEQQMAYGNMAQLGGQMAGQQFGYDQLNQQSQLGLRGQDLNYNLGKRGLDQQADQNAFNNAMQIGTAGASAVGSAMSAFSDERAKVGLGALPPGGAGEAVGEVQPMAWDGYTDPARMGQGPRVGVSAQQLQGTSLGGMVRPGPDGLLRVDGAAAGTTALAASADQEHRLRAMEARLAQQDPYASPEMQRMGGDYEREAGMQREREASQLSNEIASARGQGQMRRGLMDGPRDPFEGAPQMQRDTYDTRDPQMRQIMERPSSFSENYDWNPDVDPFTDQSTTVSRMQAMADRYNRGELGPYVPSFETQQQDRWLSAVNAEDRVARPQYYGERGGPGQREPMSRPRRGLVQVTDYGSGPSRAEPFQDPGSSHLGQQPMASNDLQFTPEGERGVGPGAMASVDPYAGTPFPHYSVGADERRALVDAERMRIRGLSPEDRAREYEAHLGDLRGRDQRRQFLIGRDELEPQRIQTGRILDQMTEPDIRSSGGAEYRSPRARGV